jgi:cob(I)alamin adenosyltransferase
MGLILAAVQSTARVDWLRGIGFLLPAWSAPVAAVNLWRVLLGKPAFRGLAVAVSIATKTGDDGTTALMYGRRVPKNHPRVETYGTVDELNAALGVARATTDENVIHENLLAIQKDLIVLMGELAVMPEDLSRYAKDGYSVVTPGMAAKLDAIVREIEAQNVSFKGWATPGATVNSAALDVARTICRRGERRACALKEAGELPNTEIIIYLNRLSDLLWLMARQVESKSGPATERL